MFEDLKRENVTRCGWGEWGGEMNVTARYLSRHVATRSDWLNLLLTG